MITIFSNKKTKNKNQNFDVKNDDFETSKNNLQIKWIYNQFNNNINCSFNIQNDKFEKYINMWLNVEFYMIKIQSIFQTFIFFEIFNCNDWYFWYKTIFIFVSSLCNFLNIENRFFCHKRRIFDERNKFWQNKFHFCVLIDHFDKLIS